MSCKEKTVLTKRAESISPSLTLAITAKVKKMKADGISVIGFGAGEPDFNTPDFIIEAANEALSRGFTKYTPSSGMQELRKAIADKLKKDLGLDYESSQIIVSNGGKHSLYNIMMVMVEQGDEVIIPAPYWLTYPELVKMAEGTPVIAYTKEENGFKLTATELENAITEKTKLLILNSPSNPTGAVYSCEELKSLAEVCERRGIYVISDEIYEKLVYLDKPCGSIATLSEYMHTHTIIANGMSKTYSMTGWRIGFVAAPKFIAKAIDGFQSHATSNPNSIAQYASVRALTDSRGDEFLIRMKNTFNERRKYMVERIKTIADISCTQPDGAFYVFINVSKILGKTAAFGELKDAIDVADAMLDYGVAVIPGNAFGANDHIRLSYAISMDDIKEGLNRIEKFVLGLQ